MSVDKTASRGREIFERRRENIRDDKYAGMAELVYALVLGTSGATLGSSSLPPGTFDKIFLLCYILLTNKFISYELYT